MRSLTEAEIREIEQRRLYFEGIRDEIRPALKHFIGHIGVRDSFRIENDLSAFLPTLSQFMSNQIIEPDMWAWAAARIAYFLGEFFVERYGGEWHLNEIPDSRFFARIVVGRFGKLQKKNLMVDPFEAARLYVSSPPGRSLTDVVAEIERNLIAQ